MQGNNGVWRREWVSKESKAWCKLVESSEGLSEREVRHEEYVWQDSFQVFHVAQAMVGICEGSYQVGNLVLQLLLCGFVA